MKIELFSRRYFCGLAFGCIAPGALPFAAVAQPIQREITLPEFRNLSRKLTDVHDLNFEMAIKILDSLIASGHRSGLVSLIDEPDADDNKLANQIVADWYSGTIETPTGRQTISFKGALVWNAISPFTKPRGDCGGKVGYWSLPPTEGEK